MRTTLTLDDDILQAVRERARRERRSAGAVLSDLAREALSGRHRPSERARARNGFPTLPPRGAPVTNELIDRLREEEPD